MPSKFTKLVFSSLRIETDMLVVSLGLEEDIVLPTPGKWLLSGLKRS